MNHEDDNINADQIISSCEFLSGIPKEVIEDLSPYFIKIELSAGKKLFSQGDDSDFIFILLSGQLTSRLIKSSQEVETLGTINPGETVGELGALSLEKRSLTVSATVNSELLRLPSEKFRALCSDYPSVVANISKLIIARSQKTLKLLALSKHSPYIFVVSFLSNAVSKENFSQKIKLYLNQFKKIAIEEETTPFNFNVKVKKYEQEETEYNKIIFFLDPLDEELFKAHKTHIQTLYLIFSEEDRKISEEWIKKIRKIHSDNPDLRLELVLIHPDKGHRIVNTNKWLNIIKFNLHHHLHADNEEDYQRLARFMTGNAVTLVLGGGGGKGLLHLGVIKAMHDMRVPIDAIGGTSIGASIAAAYAYTRNYNNTLALINKLKYASLQSLSLWNLTWPIISLFSSNPGTKALIYLFDRICIEDLFIPCFAVSANLSRHCEVAHTKGLVWEAIRSTTAIPGLFPPVALDGEIHYDGGLLNNLPVDVMRRLVGKDNTIIAVSVSKVKHEGLLYQFPPVVTLKEAIMRKFTKKYVFPSFFQTFLDSLLLGSLSTQINNEHNADILIKPSLLGYKTLTITEAQQEKLMQIGYDETVQAINHFVATRF